MVGPVPQINDDVDRVNVSNAVHWDCPDAEEEYSLFNRIAKWTLERASKYDLTNRSFFVPSSWNESNPFFCLSSKASEQGFSSFNLSQLVDGSINCARGMDERNPLKECSQPSSLLER